MNRGGESTRRQASAGSKGSQAALQFSFICTWEGGHRRRATQRRQERRLSRPNEGDDSVVGPRLGLGGLHWLSGPEVEWAGAEKKPRKKDLGLKNQQGP
jgi:hypothetical protein